MQGMKFYSQEVVVPSGQEVHVDLTVQPGTVTVDVSAQPKSGQLGIASAWLATGVLAASTESQLRLIMAGAGSGASQWVIIRKGEPAKFTEITDGAFTAGVVPSPLLVHGQIAIGFAEA